MREMKDSGVEWIGEIPVNWELSKIGSVYDERNEKVSDKDFAPLSVTKQGIVPQLETAAKTDNGDNRKLIRKNDFVINSRSDRRGSCGISEYEGSCSLINTVLKPQTNMCNRYYGFVFKSDSFADEYYRWGHGIVDDLWSTKWIDMKSIYIPAPNIAEQERIADYLDAKCSKIDEIIEKQQAIIEKLKENKLSIITEAVTKGLNPDAEMKDSGSAWFGDIPTHWECVVSKFVFEKVSDINHFMPESVDSGYPYLMIGDLRGRVSDIDFKKCKKISKEDFDSLKQKMKSKKGDVIFARYATIGTVCYVDIDVDFLVSYACVTVRPNKKLYGEYLYYYFKSCAFRENVKQFINSNTQENVGIEALCRTKITLPPYKEQKLIVDYLNKKCKNISIRIEMKRQLIDKLQEYKKSLIYEVVTGKKEV